MVDFISRGKPVCGHKGEIISSLLSYLISAGMVVFLIVIANASGAAFPQPTGFSDFRLLALSAAEVDTEKI